MRSKGEDSYSEVGREVLYNVFLLTYQFRFVCLQHLQGFLNISLQIILLLLVVHLHDLEGTLQLSDKLLLFDYLRIVLLLEDIFLPLLVIQFLLKPINSLFLLQYFILEIRHLSQWQPCFHQDLIIFKIIKPRSPRFWIANISLPLFDFVSFLLRLWHPIIFSMYCSCSFYYLSIMFFWDSNSFICSCFCLRWRCMFPNPASYVSDCMSKDDSASDFLIFF